MQYNVTNHFENVTDFNDLLALPNQSTGYFWLGMLVMIFSVLTMSFLSYGFEVALITSGFISLILGMLLVYMGLITWQWLMMFLGIVLFMIFYITWNNRKTTA